MCEAETKATAQEGRYHPSLQYGSYEVPSLSWYPGGEKEAAKRWIESFLLPFLANF